MENIRNPMEDFEKIRTVGKGAFGVATLYKKKSNDHLVILKEVNTADLSNAEFEFAMNEVEVLSFLQHPNIIGYGGSFVVDGVLMIEMEYADGGTLSEVLSKKKDYISEDDILLLLRQIASAIAYMHENNILHRDLKTANVFLNVNGSVKIGDFGIAKILNTSVPAQTVLGTPYYISPEMCEGKVYDEKSDMWAMGCILYEMCCLQRAFQASSLSALINKIMLENVKPIPDIYTTRLNRLVMALLDKNPDNRPTAREILDDWIPEIASMLSEKIKNMEIRNKSEEIYKNLERSILYEYKFIKDEISISPIKLPPKMKITNVSVGSSHHIAVNEEGSVYAWGEGDKGQLGLGKFIQYTSNPQLIDSILNKYIIMSAAGKDYTILLTKCGKIFTFGNGSDGALGHGDFKNRHTPKLINEENIREISSSFNHVAAVTVNGDIFTWGRGNKGQTGQNVLVNSNTPVKIKLLNKPLFISLGIDATFINSNQGKLYACGWNNANKLSLLKKYSLDRNTSDCFKTVSAVKYINGYVTACSIGRMHSLVQVRLRNGTVAIYIMGNSNSTVPLLSRFPKRVSFFDRINVKLLRCGDTYDLIGTNDNAVLIWGSKRNLTSDGGKIKDQWSESIFSSQKSMNVQNETIYSEEHFKRPKTLLSLYASESQKEKSSYLKLFDLQPKEHSAIVLVNCNVPLKTFPKEVYKIGNSLKEQQVKNNFSSYQSLPNWLREDIALTEFTWHK